MTIKKAYIGRLLLAAAVCVAVVHQFVAKESVKKEHVSRISAPALTKVNIYNPAPVGTVGHALPVTFESVKSSGRALDATKYWPEVGDSLIAYGPTRANKSGVTCIAEFSRWTGVAPHTDYEFTQVVDLPELGPVLYLKQKMHATATNTQAWVGVAAPALQLETQFFSDDQWHQIKIPRIGSKGELLGEYKVTFCLYHWNSLSYQLGRMSKFAMARNAGDFNQDGFGSPFSNTFSAFGSAVLGCGVGSAVAMEGEGSEYWSDERIKNRLDEIDRRIEKSKNALGKEDSRHLEALTSARTAKEILLLQEKEKQAQLDRLNVPDAEATENKKLEALNDMIEIYKSLAEKEYVINETLGKLSMNSAQASNTNMFEMARLKDIENHISPLNVEMKGIIAQKIQAHESFETNYEAGRVLKDEGNAAFRSMQEHDKKVLELGVELKKIEKEKLAEEKKNREEAKKIEAYEKGDLLVKRASEMEGEAFAKKHAFEKEIEEVLAANRPNKLDELKAIKEKIETAKRNYIAAYPFEPASHHIIYGSILDRINNDVNTMQRNKTLQSAAQITVAVIGIVILTATAAAVLTMGMPTPYANIAYKIEYEKNEQPEQSDLQVRAVRSEL